MKSTSAASTNANAIAYESWLIAAIGIFLFIAGSWHQPFIAFESRFALFAQEMLRHGPQLFPTTYGQPYPDYPVTGTLLIWLFSLPFGEITRFSAVLPTAIASSLELALLYRLLAPYSRQWALIALCLQLMTANFLAEARSISLDQMLATISLLCFYLLNIANNLFHATDRKRLLRWLPLLLLGGFAIRGPLGVVIPTAVMCAHCIAMRNWHQLWRITAMASAVLLLTWGVLLLVTQHYYGTPFMRDVINMQVFGRLDSQTATRPLLYFTSSFGNYALTYPLAIVVIALVGTRIFRTSATPTEKLLQGFLLWALIVMVGMSIPHVKKARYLLPIVPALAAIAAYPWAGVSLRSLTWIRNSAEKLFSVLPTLLAIAIAVVHHRAKHHHGGIHIPLASIYGLLVAAQIAAVWFYFKATVASRSILLAAISAASMWVVLLLVVEPVLRQLHDTAHFVAATEALREQKPGGLALYGMTKDGEAIKYLVNVPHDLSPLFVQDKNGITELARPVYLVVNNSDIESISDALGQNEAVIKDSFDGHPFSVFFLAP